MTTTVSLTELRQRLFQLADQVVDTGEPVLIVRHGVRLQLVREGTPAEAGGRLARLVRQTAMIGSPLAPDESPSSWNADALVKVAEAAPPWVSPARPRSRRAK
jgi:hypothetical protein